MQVSYFPNKGDRVKRANKFETPGDEPNIMMIVLDPKTPCPIKYFKEMEKHGYNLVNSLDKRNNYSRVFIWNRLDRTRKYIRQ